MKTATYLLRLTPQERARLDELSREQHVTLAHALREGARMYLEELHERGDQERALVT